MVYKHNIDEKDNHRHILDFHILVSTKVTLCIEFQIKLAQIPNSYVLENSLTFSMSPLISWGCFLPSHV